VGDQLAEDVFVDLTFATVPRILVAEDSEDVRELIKACLEKAGNIVDTVEDGSQAINQFLTADYNLVILDFIMPEVNGIEVLKTIRATKSSEQLPVVMITAKQKNSLVIEAARNGVNDFFVKPLRPSFIKERISNLLMSLDDGEIADILLNLNLPDPNELNPELNRKLQELSLSAYPFTHKEVKCCAIFRTGKDPRYIAGLPPDRMIQEVVLYGKGGFLWNVIWPKVNSSDSIACRDYLNVEEYLFEKLK